ARPRAAAGGPPDAGPARPAPPGRGRQSRVPGGRMTPEPGVDVAVQRRPGAFEARGGRELTALGTELRPGDAAPDAVLAGRGFVPEPIRLSDYRGRVLILSAVPSLDTGTCDRETRRWEDERRALGGDVEM